MTQKQSTPGSTTQDDDRVSSIAPLDPEGETEASSARADALAGRKAMQAIPVKLTLENLASFMDELIPFNRFLGLKVMELKPGFARIELPFREAFIGDPFRPALHGGVLSTMLDVCGGCAVFTSVDPYDRVSTVDLRVDYLLPGPLEDIACEGNVVRIGNHVAVTDMKLFAVKDPAKIIAAGKGVYNVKRS